MNIELKVDGLEFKGTINETSEEAQAMFANLLGGVFGQQLVQKAPVSNIAPPNQAEVPRVTVVEPVVSIDHDIDHATIAGAINKAFVAPKQEEDEEKYSFKDVVELAHEMSKADTNNMKDLGDYTTRPEPSGKRKLLIGECECGEKHFLWIYDNGNVHTFSCRKCGKEHTADYHKLIRANIECKNCGNKAFAYCNGTTQLEAKCRRCDSPVDLAYHEAHKCMESI